MAEVKNGDGHIARAYAELNAARMKANGLKLEPRSRKAQAPLGKTPDRIIAPSGFTRKDLQEASKTPAKKAS